MLLCRVPYLLLSSFLCQVIIVKCQSAIICNFFIFFLLVASSADKTCYGRQGFDDVFWVVDDFFELPRHYSLQVMDVVMEAVMKKVMAISSLFQIGISFSVQGARLSFFLSHRGSRDGDESDHNAQSLFQSNLAIIIGNSATAPTQRTSTISWFKQGHQVTKSRQQDNELVVGESGNSKPV